MLKKLVNPTLWKQDRWPVKNLKQRNNQNTTESQGLSPNEVVENENEKMTD